MNGAVVIRSDIEGKATSAKSKRKLRSKLVSLERRRLSLLKKAERQAHQLKVGDFVEYSK